MLGAAFRLPWKRNAKSRLLTDEDLAHLNNTLADASLDQDPCLSGPPDTGAPSGEKGNAKHENGALGEAPSEAPSEARVPGPAVAPAPLPAPPASADASPGPADTSTRPIRIIVNDADAYLCADGAAGDVDVSPQSKLAGENADGLSLSRLSLAATVSPSVSVSTANRQHRRQRHHRSHGRIAAYFYDDYNYDLQKIESWAQRRQEHESQQHHPAPGTSAGYSASYSETTRASRFKAKLSHKLTSDLFRKRKSKLAITDCHLYDVNRLVAILDTFDRNIEETQKRPGKGNAPVKKKRSLFSANSLPLSSLRDTESDFFGHHSRNLGIGEKIDAYVQSYVSGAAATPTAPSTASHISPPALSYDLIIEHERGSILFGYPFFSKSALVHPLDPRAFINQYGKAVNITQNGHTTSNGVFSYNMNLVPLDGASWQWKWDKWYVLMLDADIDDQGWLYSGLTFNSRNWRGKYRFGNSVRKRVWIRIKEKKQEAS